MNEVYVVFFTEDNAAGTTCTPDSKMCLQYADHIWSYPKSDSREQLVEITYSCTFLHPKYVKPSKTQHKL